MNPSWMKRTYFMLRQNIWDNSPNFKKILDIAISAGYQIDYIPIEYHQKELNLPLLYIALSYHEEPVMILLEAGADPNIETVKKENGLHIAIKNNRSAEIIRAIVSRVRDINSKNTNDETAFGTFCAKAIIRELKKTDFEILRALLDAGADVTDCDALREKIVAYNKRVYEKGPFQDTYTLHKLQRLEELKRFAFLYQEQVKSMGYVSVDYEYDI